MIRSLRESFLGQLFLGGVVIAIILAFALTGSSGSATVISDCAVEVGRHCVPPKAFQASYGLLTSIGINEKAAKSLNLRMQVARGLAEREVLLDKARELGISTSEADVDVELAEGRTRVSIPAAGAERLALSLALCVDGPSGCAPGTLGLRSIPVKKDGVFSYDRYKRMVRVATGRSPGHFKEAQQAELTAERVREFYRSQVKVSEEEAFLAYKRARSQATARVGRVPAAWFARYVVTPSQEAIEAWALENAALVDAGVKEREAGYKDGCPLVSEIRLAPADPLALAAPGSAKEEDPAKLLGELRNRLKTGADFEALARRYSSADSAAYGGALGCLDENYGPLADTLLGGLAELSTPGALSEVMMTSEGPVLLRVDGFVSAENRAELLRRDVARRLAIDALAREEARKFAQALIEKLQAGEPLAEANEALLTEAAARGPLGGRDNPALTVETRPTTDISRPFTISQNPVPSARGGVLPAKLVFDLQDDDDVVAEPIETEQGYAVLQLKEKDLATREKFAEDRERVLSALVSRKAEEALAQLVEELITRAGGVKYDPAFVPSTEEPAESAPAGS